MISAEAVLIFGVALFILGLGLKTFFRMSWASLVLYGVSLGLCSWVFLASQVHPSAHEVTYHPIQQRVLDDGTAVDFIVVKDVEGQSRIVNVNEALGIKVPQDSRTYHIARVQYRTNTWGLWFQRGASYRLIELP